jgi:hypothetical protein
MCQKTAKNGCKKFPKMDQTNFSMSLAPKTPKPSWLGCYAPPLGPYQFTLHGINFANNITHTQHSPTCFLCIQGVTGLHNQQSRAAMPIDNLHQENFSTPTDFVNESTTFSKVSTFINNTFLSSTMSLTK